MAVLVGGDPISSEHQHAILRRLVLGRVRVLRTSQDGNSKMIITSLGLGIADIEAAVRRVNRANERKFGSVSFGGNPVDGGATCEARHISSNKLGTTLRVKIGATSGSPAARQSGSGRNGPWACWFTFRDIFRELYVVHEDAVIRTALATYRGYQDFEEKFPDTYFANAGSEVNPRRFGELCYNLGWHDQHDRSN